MIVRVSSVDKLIALMSLTEELGTCALRPGPAHRTARTSAALDPFAAVSRAQYPRLGEHILPAVQL